MIAGDKSGHKRANLGDRRDRNGWARSSKTSRTTSRRTYIQARFDALHPELLEDVRRNPGKYPGLVVRVAGYCAYFDDLPDAAKVEMISRWRENFC
ncbi:MAG: glycine radical domain-containing protein [Actinomycetota bacterium]